MAVDAWLDTQCGVPEITVSPGSMNAHVKTTQRFTGCFNVKFRVQSRMARLHHLDARYVATQYQYLKQFVVLNRNETIIVCMDDKGCCPSGRPWYAPRGGSRNFGCGGLTLFAIPIIYLLHLFSKFHYQLGSPGGGGLNPRTPPLDPPLATGHRCKTTQQNTRSNRRP